MSRTKQKSSPLYRRRFPATDVARRPSLRKNIQFPAISMPALSRSGSIPLQAVRMELMIQLYVMRSFPLNRVRAGRKVTYCELNGVTLSADGGFQFRSKTPSTLRAIACCAIFFPPRAAYRIFTLSPFFFFSNRKTSSGRERLASAFGGEQDHLIRRAIFHNDLL